MQPQGGKVDQRQPEHIDAVDIHTDESGADQAAKQGKAQIRLLPALPAPAQRPDEAEDGAGQTKEIVKPSLSQRQGVPGQAVALDQEKPPQVPEVLLYGAAPQHGDRILPSLCQPGERKAEDAERGQAL